MDSAKYISHVGRLAVVLGLGAAVATGHGVACAEPTSSGSDSSSATGPTASDASDGSEPAGAEVRSEASETANEPSGAQSSESGTATSGSATSGAQSDAAEPQQSAAAPRTTSAEPGVAYSTGGALTSDRATGADVESEPAKPEPVVEPVEPVEPVVTEPVVEPEPEPVVEPVVTEPVVAEPASPAPVDATPVVPQDNDAVDHSDTAAQAAPATIEDAATVALHVEQQPVEGSTSLVMPATLATAVGARTSTASVAGASPLALTATSLTAAPPAPQPTFGPIRFLTAVFAAFGLAPSPVPGAPADPPLLWGILAFIRRELQRTLFNGAPTAQPEQYESSDPSVITGTVGAEDPDGDALTYTVTVEPTNGTVTLSPDGTYTYTPSDALAATGGTDSFTVVVSDAEAGFHLHGLLSFLQPGGGHTRTVVVPVTVANVNDAPTATVRVDDVTSDDGMVTGAVVGSDPDGDDLTYTRTSEPAHGTATVNADGTFSYVPTSDARHAAASELATEADKFDSFDVTVSDGNGGVVTKTVTVSVSATNTAPDITVTSTHNTDNTTTFVVTTTDADGDHVTVTTSTPVRGTLVKNTDGTYTYTPDPAYTNGPPGTAGSEQIRFTATDGHYGSDQAIGTATISPSGPVNQAPVISVATTTNSDGTTTIVVSTSDPDGDAVNVTSSNPVHGSLVRNADGSYTYTPDADYAHGLSAGPVPAIGTDTVTFAAFDNKGMGVATVVTVTINATNEAPTFELPDLTSDPDTGTITGPSGFTDPDGDALTYTITDIDPATGTLTIDEDGNFTFTPTDEARHAAADEDAPLSAKRLEFAITVTDGHGATETQTFRIRIYPANNAPTIDAAPTENSDGTTTYTITTTDPDGDTVTVTASEALHGTLVQNPDGSYTYTPDPTYAHGLTAPETDTITFTARDNHTGGVTTTTVTPTISPVNEAPTFELPDLTSDPDTGTITGPSGFTDPDGDALIYTITDIDPATGTLTIDEYGNFTFTPTDEARHTAADDDAPLSAKRLEFAITATDGHGATITETLRIRIYPANNAPTIDAAPTENPDGTTTYTITTTDPDGDTVTVDATEPQHGTLVQNPDGTYTYTPDPTYAHELTAPETDTITFTARDNHTGGNTTAEVTPTITPVNTAPTMTLVAAELTTGATIFNIMTDDADGDTVTVTAAAPMQGTLTDNGDGTWTYKPYPFASSETLTFTADDGHGGQTVATPTVYAAPNQAPTLVVTQTGSDAAARTTTFNVSTSDPNGDPVTITVSAPTYGTLTNNGDGTFTYTQVSTFHQTNPPVEKLTFTATDSRGLSTAVQKPIPLAISNTQPELTVTRTTSSTGVVTFDVTPTDADGDPVGVTATTANGYGTLTKIDADTWTFTPGSNTSGAARVESITFTATDGFGGRRDVVEQVNIPVTNGAPTITSVTSVRNTSTGAVLITVTTTDPNGDPVTVTGSGASYGTLVKQTDSTFVYTQTSGAPSTVTKETLTFTASDGKGGTDTETLDVALQSAPTINVQSVAGGGGLTTFTVTTSDADGGTVTVTPSQPAHGTLVKLGSNVWIYTPDKDYTHALALGGSTAPGSDSVTFTATDSTGLSTKAVKTVSLTPTNLNPTVTATAVRSGNTYVITVNESDGDGDDVTTTVVQPSRGTVVRTGGNWVYFPTSSTYVGTDTIVFTSTDGYGGSKTTTVTVTLPLNSGSNPLPPVVTVL